ncbi:hypothetical protein CDN99_13505 [Roseateles aquatilis]|uniref:Phosphatidylinositol kinase n=1 Tax=Roseateles aquatilis TaxID=431061 RepID=A0A246JCT1_9BURK|nr:HipA domain-containing protein [Roseateles aquatilis]OWQ90370.1 hypothetical protein CDN99_13505 [Roseateles aquatilis]
MRSLRVYMDRRPLGELFEGDDLWQLQYDPDWVSAADGFALAPGLPLRLERHVDGGTQRPVQWYFDNLLPEELLRQAIEKEAGIKGDDAFALLQYLGAESAGSLTLLPPDVPLPATTGLRVLSDAELTHRIAGIPKQTLTAQAPKRMSLAGAQHKMLVSLVGGKLYEPEGATASTHILKPSHPDASTYPASVMNEYLTMCMARAMDLPVPAAHLRHVPEPVYVVDRFDRLVREVGTRDQGVPSLEVQRLHIIDACQLLSRSRAFKHSGATLDSLKDIIRATSNRARTTLQLFRWLIFNLLIANDDCHLKNLSFFVSSHGIQLAPHYDLLATGAYHTRAFADEHAIWPDVPMAIPLPGARTFGQVTEDSVLLAGEALGLSAPTARRVLGEMVALADAALATAQAALDQAHAGPADVTGLSTASEVRFMRALTHIVVKDMKDRLTRRRAT